MKTYKLIILGILMIISAKNWSQEGLPVYSDYLTDNYYLIHPSMAGAALCGQIRVTGRKNWIGEEESPGLFTAAYNQRFGESSSAIGANFFNDKNGFSSQTGGYLTYAHHLMFSRDEYDLNMLSFGLSAGFLQYRLDQSSFNDPTDPQISGSSLSNTEFNIDIGASYQLFDFFTHITLKNVLSNEGINNDGSITDNLRNLLISVGYNFNRPGRSWSLEPSLLYSYRYGPEQAFVDFNMKAYKSMDFGRIWGGLSYRTSLDSVEFIEDNEIVNQNLKYITPFVGVNYKQFLFAYTYSAQSNPVTFNNGGFHQLTVGFNFACRPKPHKCYCPAVN